MEGVNERPGYKDAFVEPNFLSHPLVLAFVLPYW